MKTCKDCLISKDESMFYGVQRECKECTKARVRENSKRVGKAYDFSEKGVIRVIYKTQKRHQLLRGHGCMPYSKEQLKEWLYGNEFKRIYSNWVESGFDSKLKPSVDRINDFEGYSLSNIRLVTWMENREHQFSDIRNGTGKGGLRCKKVIKFNELGDVLAEYVSFSEAKRVEGYHMEYPIKNKTKCKNGYFWKYADN